MDQQNDPNPSLRFSLAYVTDPQLVEDRKRARVRMAALFRSLGFFDHDEHYAAEIALQIGVRVPVHINYHDFDRFFENFPIGEILDALTAIFGAIPDEHDKRSWLSGLATIFAEERLSYRLTQQGGVRRLIDKEFDRNLASAISTLSSSRYSAVRAEVERILPLLSEHPSANKAAIRATFDAAETLFKLTFRAAPRLATGDASKFLEPALQRMANSDAAAQSASLKMLKAFLDWIEAAHVYRHAQALEEPVEPPLGLTILLISTGVANVRWLAEIDAAVNGPESASQG